MNSYETANHPATSGAASGSLQANVAMLPAEETANFLLFCVRNPKPCPILDVPEPDQVTTGFISPTAHRFTWEILKICGMLPS